jgi:hypothetical protein
MGGGASYTFTGLAGASVKLGQETIVRQARDRQLIDGDLVIWRNEIILSQNSFYAIFPVCSIPFDPHLLQ